MRRAIFCYCSGSPVTTPGRIPQQIGGPLQAERPILHRLQSCDFGHDLGPLSQVLFTGLVAQFVEVFQAILQGGFGLLKFLF